MPKFNFDELAQSIEVDNKVFKPNLTSQLSFETAISKIQNNYIGYFFIIKSRN